MDRESRDDLQRAVVLGLALGVLTGALGYSLAAQGLNTQRRLSEVEISQQAVGGGTLRVLEAEMTDPHGYGWRRPTLEWADGRRTLRLELPEGDAGPITVDDDGVIRWTTDVCRARLDLPSARSEASAP